MAKTFKSWDVDQLVVLPPLVVTDEIRAFNNFLRYGMSALSADDHALMLTLHDPKFQAAAGTDSGAGGGIAVPDSAMHQTVEAMPSPSRTS